MEAINAGIRGPPIRDKPEFSHLQMLYRIFSDKKKNWVPVEIPMPSIKPESNKRNSSGGKKSAQSNIKSQSKTADSSKNWRDDAKDPSKNRQNSKSQKASVKVAATAAKRGSRGGPVVFGSGRGAGVAGRGQPWRGRSLSGSGGDELYTFHLDGVPSYGEAVQEPSFVTPVLGATYYYDNHYLPQTVPDDVLRGYVKAQM